MTPQQCNEGQIPLTNMLAQGADRSLCLPNFFFISGANSPILSITTPTQVCVITRCYPLTVIVGLFGFQVAPITPAPNAAAKGMMFGLMDCSVWS
jgi:hypothetical protein